MNWTEWILTVPTEELETAEAVASMAAPGGLYTEDYSTLEQTVEEIAHIDLIDESLRRADRAHARIHLYVAPDHNAAETAVYLSALMDRAGLHYALESAEVADEDWANNWRRYYHPFPVGDKLYVCPGWVEPNPDESHGRAVLTLDPGGAFGTGSHDTTRLCLTLLEKFAVPGVRMLDIGCGSGILAIAGAKLGVTEAVGVDIDPVAVRVANDNASQNGVTDAVTFAAGDLAEHVKGTFDLITANIVADVILRLLPDLPSLVNAGGHVILSGIITERENEILFALRKTGLKAVSTLRSHGWSAILVQKNA